VRRRLAGKPKALHDALEPLAECCSRHVHKLPRHKVRRQEREPHGQQRVRGDSELCQLALDGHAGRGKVAALRAVDLLGALGAAPQLQRAISLRLWPLHLDHLAVVHPQHGERQPRAPVVPLLRHAHLDGNHAGAPRVAPLLVRVLCRQAERWCAGGRLLRCYCLLCHAAALLLLLRLRRAALPPPAPRAGGRPSNLDRTCSPPASAGRRF